ncbi:DUF5694 domain-containing protein [Shewanella pneumatophori]|uniref:DUF5694 domain-containing protein n=1 Tax=Shewanella pneumatophori TaxID=314092 RepID=A0A9X1ZFG8_9GAMM|nr:DUF5694 domain-containing protein [Shewanella pneumatophori]MCL1140067.1 DUF5694 domain-containing protein [Shewanella pneumatophori]
MYKLLVLIVYLAISHNVCAEQYIQNLNAKVKHKTDVMVLGSTHLNTIEGELNKDDFIPIIQMLETFNPTAVAVESLRAEDIITMLNGSDEYQTVLSQFVGDTFLSLAKKEQKALGVSANDAIKKMNELLTKKQFDQQQRIEIIRLAVAGYNRDTAALNWSLLDTKFINGSLSKELQTFLQKQTNSNNEINVIGFKLAERLNLNRVYPIDDHLDKDMYSKVVHELMPSYQKSTFWAEFRTSEYITKPDKLKSQALETGDWLPLFYWTNSKEYQSDVINKEWIGFVDRDLEPKSAQARIALWEIRNLNMASNIMRVVADHIGGKVVIIVGSNHKVFLEQYLSNMIGINIVQFEDYAPES